MTLGFRSHPAIMASRFLSSHLMVRVPFFLRFGFKEGTLKQKGQKGTTQEPRLSC